MSKDFCDSCTDLKEVSRYEVAGLDFYWCAECAEDK